MVRLAPGVREQLLGHAMRVLPNEACGLLGGRGEELLRFVPCANIQESPIRYAMDPVEILAALRAFDAEGITLRGIFHSHPAGVPRPSATDVREAAYPDAAHLIACPQTGEVRAYRIADGETLELLLEG